MIPTQKSPMINDLIKKVFNVDREESIRQDCCAWCKKPAPKESFRNDVSLKEYTISGMCQKCQNEIWK